METAFNPALDSLSSSQGEGVVVVALPFKFEFEKFAEIQANVTRQFEGILWVTSAKE